MPGDGQKAAETIFLGGKIYTMESHPAVAHALAVAGGRFLAVGEEATVLRLKGDATRLEDLQGRVVLPGLIDSHLHLDSVGRVLQDADLYDARSIAEILEKLAAHARKLERAQAVVGRGDCFHPTSLAEGRLPSRQDLDRVAADRPVMITDVNKTIVNTFTLEKLALAEGTQAPPGGRLGRDAATGKLDGAFFFAAKSLIPLAQQSTSSAEMTFAEAVLAAGKALVAAGITSVVFPGNDLEMIGTLRRLAAAGQLPLRVTALPRVQLLAEAGALERGGLKCGAEQELVTVGPLKLFYDGLLMHRTALLHQPYEDEPENRGSAGRTPAELAEIARRAATAGWPLAVHVTGDRGLDEVAEVLAGVSAAGFACPHQVIHAYFPTPRTLDLMAGAGVAAAVQPPFHRAWGETAREFLGEERAARFTPLRAFLEAGVVCGGGSDGPIAHFRPGLGLHAAATRLTAAGRTLGEPYAVTPAEALRLYTLGSAAVTAQDGEKGSIRPGKLADLVVLECDPLVGGAEALLNLKVARTIVGGKTVFIGERRR